MDYRDFKTAMEQATDEWRGKINSISTQMRENARNEIAKLRAGAYPNVNPANPQTPVQQSAEDQQQANSLLNKLFADMEALKKGQDELKENISLLVNSRLQDETKPETIQGKSKTNKNKEDEGIKE
jgi:hypothetical protein